MNKSLELRKKLILFLNFVFITQLSHICFSALNIYRYILKFNFSIQ